MSTALERGASYTSGGITVAFAIEPRGADAGRRVPDREWFWVLLGAADWRLVNVVSRCRALHVPVPPECEHEYFVDAHHERLQAVAVLARRLRPHVLALHPTAPPPPAPEPPATPWWTEH